MFFYLVLCLIIILALFGIIILFGDLPTYQGTLISRLNESLFHGLSIISSWFQTLDDKYFNGYFTSSETQESIKYFSGWLIPVFYLVIVTKCILYFFQYSFSQIIHYESNSKTDWSLRLELIIIPVILLNYSSFLLAVFSDPGIVTAKSLDNTLFSEFPYDNLIYFKDVECSTCKILKPARSKHCSSCNKCVLMFDHHCIWLNNDIGYYTYRWFLLFLLSICIIFIYGGYLCFYSLQVFDQSSDNKYVGLSFFKRYWKIIKTTTFSNEISGILLILCIFMFPTVLFFLTEHVWFIYLGTTTNETLKWDHINELVSNKLLFKFIPKDTLKPVYLVLKRKNYDCSCVFVNIQNWTPFNSKVGGEFVRIEDWNDLNNIYDKGFCNNLKQRLFPKKF